MLKTALHLQGGFCLFFNYSKKCYTFFRIFLTYISEWPFKTA